jgi:hypothetical protein
MSRELMSRCPHLRLIALHTSGFDKVDLQAAADLQIIVTSAQGANALAVAELTIGMCIALVRQFVPIAVATGRGLWDEARTSSTELAGKTLGILGVGEVGGRVAQRAVAFDMRVIAYDPAYTSEQLRARGIEWPQNTRSRRSAIDGRTTRHPGYAMSQRVRKRVEEIFGWTKTVGGGRNLRYIVAEAKRNVDVADGGHLQRGPNGQPGAGGSLRNHPGTEPGPWTSRRRRIHRPVTRHRFLLKNRAGPGRILQRPAKRVLTPNFSGAQR